MITIKSDGTLDPFGLFLLRSRFQLMASTRDKRDESDEFDGEVDFGTELGCGNFDLYCVTGDNLTRAQKEAKRAELAKLFNTLRDGDWLIYESDPDKKIFVHLSGRVEITEYPNWLQVVIPLRTAPFWVSTYVNIPDSGEIVGVDGNDMTGKALMIRQKMLTDNVVNLPVLDSLGVAIYGEYGTKVVERTEDTDAEWNAGTLNRLETSSDTLVMPSLPDPTFTRATPAYLPGGTLVAPGEPRYYDGGVMVEEGTENLYCRHSSTANCSIVDEASDFHHTVQLVTATYSHLVHDNVVVSEDDITLSYEMRVIQGTSVQAIGYLRTTDNVVNTYSSHTSEDIVEVGEDWTKVFMTVDLSSTNKELSHLSWLVKNPTGQVVEVRNIQLEQKAYATTFTDGTRDAETLTVPSSIMPDAPWTIECVCKVADIVKSRMPIAAGDKFYIYQHTNNRPVLAYTDSSSHLATGTTALDPSIEHHWAVTFDGTTIKLFVDGNEEVSRGTDLLPEPWPTEITLGSKNGHYHLNGLIRAFRISDVIRTPSDMSDTAEVDEHTVYALPLSADLTHGQGGYRVSPALDISVVGKAVKSFITWVGTEPPNTDIIIETSLDGGLTWQEAIKDAAIVNAGTFPTPVVIEITGIVTDPEVIIDGESLQWTGTVGATDKLVIDTDKQTVTFNGINALASYKGTFPWIPPGETVISAPPNTVVRWRDAWI